jgi:KDO2-lipid IV(A) lauroyltransferase
MNTPNDQSQARPEDYGPPFPWTVEKTHAYTHAFNRHEEVKGHYFQRAIYASLLWLVQRLSWSCAFHLANGIGRLLYLLRVRYQVAKVNLDIVYGDKKTEAEKLRIYHDSMITFGRTIVSYLRIPVMDRKMWTENFPIRNEQILREDYNQGKGIVITAGHLGVWEVAAGRVGMGGYPISNVAKRQPNIVADQLIVDLREAMNMGSIMHKDSMDRIRQGLRCGEGVILAVDQNMKRDQGVFVSFLGRVASSPRANAWIWREAGCPAFCGYAAWREPKKFELVITERVPWEPHPDDPEKELLINTTHLIEAVERVILGEPSLWFWLHRRWKVQPDGVPNPYA